jgi:hypothetical protein
MKGLVRAFNMNGTRYMAKKVYNWIPQGHEGILQATTNRRLELEDVQKWKKWKLGTTGWQRVA